ncbi:MAG: phage holin family protein [Anaerolineales bacterium]|nr:phage holin family protein [Anaerolineales bacterium]
MNRFVIRLVINAVALYAAIQLVPGITAQSTHWAAIFGLALIFGVLNALISPLLKLLTCPLILLTLGLFTLLINTLIFYLAGQVGTWFDIGFQVTDFWSAFLGGLITSIVSVVLSLVFKDELKKKK